MEIWKTKSNPIKQDIVSVTCTVVGLILVIVFYDKLSLSDTDILAGFSLGVLLLLLGLANVYSQIRQVVTVDPHTRQVSIESITRFTRETRRIGFEEILDCSVVQLGDREGGNIIYHIDLKLKDGTIFPLFFPAYFDGQWDRKVTEERCYRIKSYIGLP